MQQFEARQLIVLGQAVFVALGAPEEIAYEVATSLVDANLTGHDSHGVQRIPRYAQSIRRGAVDPQARPQLLVEGGAVASVDGRRGFGQLAARFATEQAADRARVHGIGAVAATNCGHMGRMGEWAELAAARGMIGLSLLGVCFSPIAAPHGGSRRALGTNPIAFAAPIGGEAALLGDFATTVVAEGKVGVARAKGAVLPPGLIIDADGQPSTTPDDLYRGGALLPMGGHKGYALALLAEVLGCALSGAELHQGPDGYNGALFLCLAPNCLRPVADFEQATAAVLSKARSVPSAQGVEEVLIPGDPEHRSRERLLHEGIPLPEATVLALNELARELGVAVLA